eukprot:899639-Rhodomonas_salina.2
MSRGERAATRFRRRHVGNATVRGGRRGMGGWGGGGGERGSGWMVLRLQRHGEPRRSHLNPPRFRWRRRQGSARVNNLRGEDELADDDDDVDNAADSTEDTTNSTGQGNG